ncbi:hypothetical protein MAP00_006442 [Monascus purpureus]|nr:hypothetical protein MAP00_006442 [Monascus purpureus]
MHDTVNGRPETAAGSPWLVLASRVLKPTADPVYCHPCFVLVVPGAWTHGSTGLHSCRSRRSALLAHPPSPSWRRGAISGSSVDRSASPGLTVEKETERRIAAINAVIAVCDAEEGAPSRPPPQKRPVDAVDVPAAAP